MIEEKIGLDDISIVPCVLSDINSRSECIPYNEYEMLPLFTAPMNTVVDENNYQLYEENKITPIIPRTVTIEKRIILLSEHKWVAFGLDEVKKIFLDNSFIKIEGFKILIDVANGHMKQLYDIHKELKSKYNCVVMLGNIANPETYRYCCEQGVDYVRVGVGSGSGCITTSNTSIHYPMSSLIDECYRISCNFNNSTKIIADGGMRNYSDIIKSLSLGADYVMCGGLFAKMLETPGEVTLERNDYSGWNTRKFSKKINQYEIDFKFLKEDEYLEKTFYGMASKEAQKKLGNINLKTSEGLIKKIKIKYTMNGWVENFTHYLKSAMSYCGKRELKNFIGEVSIVKISNNASNAFNK